jgi:predicted permease
MRWLDLLKLRLRTLVLREQAEADLRREMEFHLQEQIAENRAKGMSAEEARYAALRAIGGIAQIQEQCRDQRGLHWLETTIQDVRYSLRSLRKSPAFTLVAILSLALGTGANTAIFSLIDSILLNSLPVKDPQQLVFVRTNRTKVGNFMVSTTMRNRDVDQMEQQARLFDGIASYNDFERANVSVRGHAELAHAEFVSGTYFSVLGVPARIGRTLVPEDDRPTGSSAPAAWPAVISDGYWRRRFGGEAGVIGQPIAVNTIPFVIVGVMPRDFNGLSVEERPDVVMPLMMHDQVVTGSASAGFPGPNGRAGEVLARLQGTIPQSKAAAELTVIFHQTELAQGNLSTTDREKIARQFIEFDSAARGSSMLRQRFSDPLRALMAAVALVMLIACANIASLLLAKSSARQKEIAVRLSLGSSRRRIIRQLLTESLILSVSGCTFGLGFAMVARKVTLELGHGAGAGLSMHWDLRLLIFLATICILNALLFGLIPALRATKVDPNTVLKSAQATQYSARLPFGRVLVGAQLAISLVLVAGAALLLGTLRNLYQVDLGFNSENLLMATMDPRLAGFDDMRTETVYKQVLEDVKRLPSVDSATLTNNRFLSGRALLSAAKVVGYVPEKGEDLSNSWIVTYGVGPHFFETLRLPLAEGRDFSEADKEGAPPVVVINEAMAKHYFRDKDPIGQKIDLGRPGRRGSATKTAEIVGVARDAHYFDIQDEKQEAIFTPLMQVQIGEFGSEETLVARTNGDPTRIANDVRAVVRQIDSNLPLFDITTMKEQFSDDLSTSRLMATLSSFFGLLALALSAIGLYGVLAYSVTRRTAEIGIRMALGADRGSILKMILGETTWVVATGIVVGLGLAWTTSRLIKSLLYGLTGHDVRVLAISSAILALVALFAVALPARRAVHVDPMVALRYE